MLRRFLSLGLVCAALGVPAHASDVAACKAMQATLAPRQAEIAELTSKRDASAELAEAAGEAWEDAEIHRLVSQGHAEQADNAEAAYADARRQLARDEMGLQATLKQFNTDVTVYNSRCASEG